jgi:alpha,alpha-trehalose phosphorylase
MFTFSEAFTPEQKLRNFDYYEALTVRDSSLSACIQAVVAAEVGHVDLAYDYFGEAALLDLDDLEHNTRDGVHIASLAGSAIVALAGFGGLRDRGPTVTFMPRLPDTLERLAFRIRCRGRALAVEVTPAQATYTLTDGEDIEIRHHGEQVTLTSAKPVTRPIPRPPRLEEPRQPPGRAPKRRRPPPHRPE